MTISIWRYCHFILALVSSLFLLVASVTGVILAVEPISHQAKGYAVEDLDAVTLSTAITTLKDNYDEVFSLEVESSGFVKASVLTEDFETRDIYINPISGKQLGEVAERPVIYSFATNLHRSLFLKSIGRFFVGFVSLLLFIIAITGIVLLTKRQGGIKKIFSKVQKDYFEMRYHVVLSRWLFVPIVIIALTGVYLSAEKFNLLPTNSVEFKDINSSEELSKIDNLSEIPIFQNTKLSEVRKVEFPFSEDAEDYFHIALRDREIKVNQQTGQIVSSAKYPFAAVISSLSLTLHTGEGSVLWSIILCIASASILFFMYSGFVMTLKRRKKVVRNLAMTDKDESEYIILVGSETGKTFAYAQIFCNALLAAGQKVFMTELNNYTVYKNAKQIIILTATYGEGEPPTNARKFETIFPTIKQPNKIEYSIVGFGSLEYPDYCKFAITIDAFLKEKSSFQSILPIYKINNSNFAAFENWAKKLSAKNALQLKMAKPVSKKKKLKIQSFKVEEKTDLNVDDTFLLRLKPSKKTNFTSGDLLSVFPKGKDFSRQYSIAKIGNEILLSVKKHEFGIVSSFLFTLQKGETIRAAVEKNPEFHFPKSVESAILIANGTGIAPFLGMIRQNNEKNIQLFWGGRFIESSNIYDSFLKSESQNLKVIKSFSREAEGKYVQDLIYNHSEAIIKNFENNGIVMICGALAMQHDVLNALEIILKEKSTLHLDDIQFNGQLKMDCY